MGYTIALIGIALCVLLCGIGSCLGLYKTSTAAAGILGEDPKKFGKVMVLVLLPFVPFSLLFQLLSRIFCHSCLVVP